MAVGNLLVKCLRFSSLCHIIKHFTFSIGAQRYEQIVNLQLYETSESAESYDPDKCCFSWKSTRKKVVSPLLAGRTCRIARHGVGTPRQQGQLSEL